MALVTLASVANPHPFFIVGDKTSLIFTRGMHKPSTPIPIKMQKRKNESKTPNKLTADKDTNQNQNYFMR
ncbi:hypothetical protein DP116_12555 [Brasilonema bromeliae SPC951]|uniref:Uncharacterized protein n=1 Tax=Brasilonema bromeliae SPC951 TaxID=385972 RepID=A0ABX1P8W3_9CYAN|nr:hypothetical protein [Brasilonema bromeliae SPC951]